MFSCNETDILSVDLNNINYDEDEPGTIIHARLLAFHNKFKKRKAVKKELNEELMPVA